MEKNTHCVHGHPRTPENVSLNGNCKACNKIRSQKHRDSSGTIHQYWRDRQLLKKYNLTRERWQIQFDKQDGKCLGCGIAFDSSKRETKPCVDHCHKTKVFRGLLCHSCNRGIGLLKESVATMQRLVAYLTHAEQRASTEGCDIECSGQERLPHEKDFEHPPVGHSSVDDSITPL